MNLSQIKAEIRALVASETSSTGSHWDSTYDSAFLNPWINEGYGIILDYARWPFLLRESYFTTYYTTIAATAVSGATSIDVDDTPGANLFVGDWLYLKSGSTYYAQMLSAINYTTKALTISPLTTDFADGDTVAKFDHKLNYDVKCVVSMYDMTNNNRLKNVNREEYDEEYITARASGDPLYYCVYSNYDISETSLTADAGSSTEQVVDSALKACNDYYNGWVVNGDARVSDTVYSGGTTTLTLETLFLGTMTTGTSYSVVCDLPLVKIYPLPDAATNIGYTYVKRIPPLFEGDNCPQFGPDGDKYQRLLVIYGAAKAFQESGDANMSGTLMQQFYQGLERMHSDLIGRGRSKERWTFKL